ncbi:hypothetical protein LJC08_03920 [Methanimicrococcus sp. OttesenSCG-928-J09]|nr:hypothetical protein [Methanimicrococcus sp. OttesenSCG-928-J09]
MKTENKIVIIIFVMAFSTLFLLYTAVQDQSSFFSGAEKAIIPTKEDVGKSVYVEGTVLNKKSTFQGGHLIVNIECTDKTVLMIFIPKSAGAESADQMIEIGNKIGVKGNVEEYNGTLEVVLKTDKNLQKLK